MDFIDRLTAASRYKTKSLKAAPRDRQTTTRRLKKMDQEPRGATNFAETSRLKHGPLEYFTKANEVE
jgi:hypothetical protein